MVRNVLVIGEVKSLLYDHKGLSRVVDRPNATFPKILDIYLNASDLDLNQVSIPNLGFWDRHRFVKTRASQHQKSLLTGSIASKSCLMEATCPITPSVDMWLQELVKLGIRVRSIRPLLLPVIDPLPDQYTLVVSDHGPNGVRQTAYQGDRPVFTRLSMGRSIKDEILATLAYLKNQFSFNHIRLQCHIRPTEMESLHSIANDEIELQSHLLVGLAWADTRGITQNSVINLSVPAILKETNRRHMAFIGNIAGAVAATLLFAASGWQYYDYTNALTKFDNMQAQSSLLDDSAKKLGANLSLEQLLPDQYKTRLKDPSPIAAFMGIGIALTNDITLSGIKWENTAIEERVLLEVKIVHMDDDADQKLDAIQEFRNNLQDALPAFQVTTQSLPHGSGELETFAGSTSGQDLTLAGDQGKARIEMIRKKST
jgi:hypothetical protein